MEDLRGSSEEAKADRGEEAKVAVSVEEEALRWQCGMLFRIKKGMMQHIVVVTMCGATEPRTTVLESHKQQCNNSVLNRI